MNRKLIRTVTWRCPFCGHTWAAQPSPGTVCPDCAARVSERGWVASP